VNLQFLSELPPDALPATLSGRPEHVLGGARLGELTPASAPAWPVQAIAAPLLGASRDSLQEIWRCDAACAAGESEGIRWRRAGNLLYGVIELDESDFAPTAGGSALQTASAEAYRRIFRLLEAQGLPSLWRVWNYLAAINEEVDGLERYRQFNIGRQDAFLEFRRGATGNVPAACAIGLAGGPLSIAFMAGDRPAVPVENPRQISAYNYPAEYGPRSPTFSRAALVYLPGQEILFVSGTASIVGHRTVHADDVVGQCRESLANIAVVVAEAGRLAQTAAYALDELSYRVYIRHAGDFPAVQATLAELVGEAVDIVYLQADICRADLLLEIEAMASHTLENFR
jgi:enamine deaminase RidA (YjgF/YER057c/UK114 family)